MRCYKLSYKLTLPISFLELYSYGNNNDIEGFSRLRSLVNNPDLDPIGLSPSPSMARTYSNTSVPAPNHYQHSFSSSTRPGPQNMAPNVNGTGPSMYGLATFSQSQCSQISRTTAVQTQPFLFDTRASVASLRLQRCVRLDSRCFYSVVH